MISWSLWYLPYSAPSPTVVRSIYHAELDRNVVARYDEAAYCPLGQTAKGVPAVSGENSNSPERAILHTQSSQFVELHPTGYLFITIGSSVRLVYYHDEPRVFREDVAADGTSSFQFRPLRIQDVAVNILAENFVRHTADNLRNIATQIPGLLDKYGITING
jgi:hypothetical protein